ncbi:DUF3857 domain-containing transglutaminase family protein [Lutibacter sp. TH_r2]|uniref:DUF3857 domain-containing transglutaminase family protein n=1 Tax=Lutibacter sp. TH_r2 TaxID=3082083 RepID=UPI002954019B|nr:DUF3857 domain-containing transglutaminase family protein [Lutibacter sp. TH_r2]MDV7187771.1 DUF3857 domain-containing transglutaminase family protein [Lutibacter sp. TH_r2]
MKFPQLITVVVILLCTSVFYSQEFDFNVQNIPESLTKNANSVLRVDNTEVEIKSQRLMVCSYNIAVTVLNKQDETYGDITIYYDKRRKIKNVSGFVYDSNGKLLKKIKNKDFKDFSAADGSLFSDSRLIHYDYTPISYPFTVHYTYEIETSNTAFIPQWLYVSSFETSVEKSKFKITYPEDINLKMSKNNFDNFKVEIEEIENGLQIEANTIPAIKYESHSLSISDLVPRIKFAVDKFNLEGVDGEASNWKEYGEWFYNNLVKNTLDVPESTKQKIINITRGVEKPIDKAKIIYKYVQDKVRYISVQIGVGGFKPMLASDVDRLGYGDCKALTNYTAALLRVVDIQSHHVLVYADRKRNIDNAIASQEGNHMILYLPIDNKDIWLECTSQDNAFGEIGDFTNDRDVLVLTPEGGEIKHTRIYKPEESIQKTIGNYSVKLDGSIEASVNISSTGIQYNNHLGRFLGNNTKELEMEFKNYFSNINNINFSVNKVENDKANAIFKEELKFSALDYATFSGEQMFITVNAFNKSSYVPKRVKNRKLPFEIGVNFIDIDEVKIKLPETYKVEFIPENVQLTSKYGEYSMELIKINESEYLYKRKMKLVEGKYSKEEYDLYRAFRKKIKKFDNAKIILNKNN